MLDNLSPLVGSEIDDTAAENDPGPINDTNKEGDDVPAGEEKLAAAWLNKIDKTITFRKGEFEIMKENRKFAEGIQWPGQTEHDERYVMNVTKAVVRRKVNSLYAKNPDVVARPHEKMDFMIWEEDQASLQAALADPANPFNQALLADILQGMQRKNYVKNLCRTLELVIKREIRRQQPNFKREMKRMLRREEIDGVGIVKLDYVREMDVKPDIQARIDTLSNRMAYIRELMEDQREGEYDCGECDDINAAQEQLAQALEALHEQKYIMKREGAEFRFPKNENIIIDKECTQLEGFVGANFVAERYWLTDDQIEEIYDIEIDGSESEGSAPQKRETNWTLLHNVLTEQERMGKPENAREVFEVYDRKAGNVFTIARGYKGYCRKPSPVTVFTPHFYPYYAMYFNETESDTTIYPSSTVRDIMPMQKEMNRAKEALRQHRIAARPLYASAKGAMEEEDKVNMATHEAHDIVEVAGLELGQPVDGLLQQVKKHPIDPNVYETNTTFDDMTKVSGTAPSTLSTTSDSTATEATIAEASNQSDAGSNSDDQDDLLSMMMNDLAHNLMMQMDIDTVRRIAGPGAVWVQGPEDDYIEDIYCDIIAGSSGRPNRAAEGAALQRLWPLLAQIPGMRPEWLARKATRVIDENVDLTDAWLAGLPAIMQAARAGAQVAPMNGTGAPPTGDPATNPGDQGGQGANNAPGPQMPTPGPLAGMPMTAAGPQDQAHGGMLAKARQMLNALVRPGG